MLGDKIPSKQGEKRHSWTAWRTPLIAACIVAAIIALITGTFTTHLWHTQAGKGSASFQLRPGWQQIVIYSGMGNSTRGVTRQLPPLWASTITCTGDGKVDIDLLGVRSEDHLGIDSCQSPQLSLAQPTSFQYNISSPETIQTIKVTANARTSWQLHLLQATRQPTFQLGSEWTQPASMISGSGIAFTRNSPHDAWHRQTPPAADGIEGELAGSGTSAQHWGILTACFGTGSGHIQLSPSVGTLTLPPCDGQPKLTVLRFPTSIVVHALTISASGDMIWSAGMVACRDEARCQQEPALRVTPTPGPNPPLVGVALKSEESDRCLQRITHLSQQQQLMQQRAKEKHGEGAFANVPDIHRRSTRLMNTQRQRGITIKILGKGKRGCKNEYR